jgi:hypothetical protein
MKNLLILTLGSLGFSAMLSAQSNPSARLLPYSENFNGMLAPTYPVGWVGWTQATLPGAFQLAAPTGDRALTANGNASSTTNNVYDFSTKLGFLNSGTTNHAIATALVTTGWASINVSYSVMTIRDNNERTLVLGLQYRVGTSGPFTNIPGSGYNNSLIVQTSGNSGVNVQTRSVTLPAVCNNQSVVQLRFIAKDSIGSGARPSFAIDNFSASGTSCSGLVVSAAAQSSTTFCSGGSVVLRASGASTYMWSNNQTGDSIVVTQPGTYFATGTDVAGCVATSNSIPVTVNSAPTITISPNGPIAVCQGAAVNLQASGASSYQWNNGQTTDSISVNATGNYQVVGTTPNGCSDSASVQVVVNSLPTVSINSNGPLTFCQGAQVTLSASGAQSYSWSTSALTDSISATQSGGYFVVGTDQNGCSDTSQVVQVLVHPLPQITITPSGPTSICQGSSVQFFAQGGSSYVWPCGCPGQSQFINSSGPVRVWGTDLNGCSDSSNTVMVTVNPNPTAQITPNGPSIFCQGDSLSLLGVSGLTNSWNTNQISDSISVNQSGLYTLLVTDANGCSDSTSLQIFVNALPQIGISVNGNTTLCQGDSVELVGTGALTYAWNTAQSGSSIWVSTSGTFYVQGTDLNGCSDSSAALQISVIAPPVVLSQPANVQDVPGNNAVFAVASQDPNDAFQWEENPGTGFQPLSDGIKYAGTATSQLTVANIALSDNGNAYRCQISNGACTVQSQSALLTVNPNSGWEGDEPLAVRLFPNPASNFISVWQSAGQVKSNVSILDLNGKVLISSNLFEELTTLNIEFLPSGMYQLLVGNSVYRFTKK